MMEKSYYDLQGQAKRAAEIRRRVIELQFANFDDNGLYQKWAEQPDSYEPNSQNLPSKELLNYAVTFLSSDDPKHVKMANTLICNVGGSGKIAGLFNAHRAVVLYCRFKNKLSPESQNYCLKGIERFLQECKKPTAAFTGINDNFPVMYMVSSLIGGRLLNDEEAYQKGLWLIDQLKRMLHRRGLYSEYTSNNYNPIVLEAFEHILEFSDDDAVKADIRDCAERMWADVMTHYHPLCCAIAGPYSRAYTGDNLSQSHSGRYMYSVIFGDKMPVNVHNTLLAGPNAIEGFVPHHGVAFNMSEAGWQASAIYHCPEYLVKIALEKTYPYRVSGTTECRSRRDVTERWGKTITYPGTEGFCSTYMTENYGVGFATRDFSNGMQTNNFQLVYRKRPLSGQRDIGVAYAKYIMNESDLEKYNVYPGGCSSGPYYQVDTGRKLAVGKDNSGMVMYKPKHWAAAGVTSMRLSILLPCHYGTVEKLWLDGNAVDLSGGNGIKAESAQACTIIVKDGPVYMGYKPLTLTDHGRKAAVRIHIQGNYLMISLYNYEGENKEFGIRTLYNTCNGYVWEIRDENEIAGYEAMQALMDSFVIEDYMLNMDGEDGERYVRARRPGLDLSACHCPETEAVKYLTVNGLPLPQERFYADGIAPNDLPLL